MNLRRTSGFLILCCIAAFILASCALLIIDYFPAYLGQEKAVAHFSEIVKTAGLSETTELHEIYLLTVPGSGKKFVVLRVGQFMSPETLIFLDGTDLRFLRSFTNIPIGKFLTVDMGGYIVTGWNTQLVRLYPDTLEPENTPPNPSPTIDFAQFAFTAEVGSDITTYLVGIESDCLNLIVYNNDWSSGSSYSQSNLFDSQSITNFEYRDLFYDGTGVQLAVTNKITQESFVISWSTLTEFVNAFSNLHFFAENATNVVSVPRGDGQAGGLTNAGYIQLMYGYAKKTILDRRNTSTGQQELPVFTMPDNFRGRFAFFRDASAWVLYNQRDGKIHLLRPWW
ncbi:hypothetical protein [Gracilinema caldarium]|uniref:hypothetical protein n=1 Tax=Gracilinema caldarium TaxID=215591 RepID=UPI0026EA9CB9|nr:hypothetical protein [Gracilinema caldarium]